VGDPIAQIVDLKADHLVPGRQGQVPNRLFPIPLLPIDTGVPCARYGHAGSPVHHLGMVQCPADIRSVLIPVKQGYKRKHGLEIVAGIGGRDPLGVADIGTAHCSDRAVTPGLGEYPLVCVESILSLVNARVPCPL